MNDPIADKVAAPAAQSQTALDERVIEDDELNQALEDLEKARGRAKEANKKKATMKEIVEMKLDEHDLADDDAVRVGRFRITKKAVESRSVSFTTEPTTRLNIGVVKDD